MDDVSSLTFDVERPGGRNRLREMIVYVSKRCEHAERFGKIKLNKILWRADFSSFRDRGVPVTGTPYQKLAAGPAPIDMEDTLGEMQQSRSIEIRERELADGYIEHRVLALREPTVKYFDRLDLYYAEKSIKYYWAKSGSNASDLSHRAAWKTRNFLQPMPYESAFLSDDRLTVAQKERFHALARENGWKSR